MAHAAPKPQGLPHAVFLGRVGSHPVDSPEVRLGQGAFLVMRLVDLLAPEREPVHAQAFRYQWTATGRYCSELEREGTEAAHLSGLVGIAAEAAERREVRLLAPGLLAYTHYLEDEARYEEALDVLETLLQLGEERLARSDVIAARLRVGRVNRKLARFEDAEAAYAAAGALAAAEGDTHSVLLSRMGRANATLGRGNLAEAERDYRTILADAHSAGWRDAEARAEHGLGVALQVRGQLADAIPHLWRAFGLYEDEPLQMRALNDLGITLLALGDAASAERALQVVVRNSRGQDHANNALIELMHCASYRRDRMGFERWRSECEAHAERMPPNVRADFHLKAGIGLARFGNFRRAVAQLDKALTIAAERGLREFEFRIERIKAGLRGCQAELPQTSEAAAEPVLRNDDLREVSASLARLGV